MSNVTRLRRSVAIPLSNATLQLHSNQVAVPTYDRGELRPSIVHIGMGNFHRAHQAVYFDDLASRGISRRWGITGVNLRRGEMSDSLKQQDWLYTVVERSRERDTARVVGSISQAHYAGENKSAVLKALSDERTRIVTMTITGDAYCIDNRTGEFNLNSTDVRTDLRLPNHCSTTWGYLAEALARRRRAGIAPFTVMSCDNVPDNGRAARTALVSFAGLRDPSLGRWIDRHVAFPATMVDRITPKTTGAEQVLVEQSFGIEDRRPVFAEPFRQWVIEDTFCNGRPPLEEVGVEFVTDVAGHKLVKTRLLNGSHSAIAYLALLAGYERVDEAMRDPVFGRYVEQLLYDEIAPLLPAVRHIDIEDYCATTIDRLRNPRISDRLERLAARGSVKMPAYLLPSLHEAIAAERPHAMMMLAVAGWARYLRGKDLEGRDIHIDDPQAKLLNTLATLGRNYPDPLLRNHDVFGDLRLVPGFVNRLGQLIEAIDQQGVAWTLHRHTAGDSRKLVGR
ncbi:MAG: mannitol 2-dehydrogenase [Mycobacterium sp.]|nr:mannitol 2-dehydrogenase [Mycobacterium sp.]